MFPMQSTANTSCCSLSGSLGYFACTYKTYWATHSFTLNLKSHPGFEQKLNNICKYRMQSLACNTLPFLDAVLGRRGKAFSAFRLTTNALVSYAAFALATSTARASAALRALSRSEADGNAVQGRTPTNASTSLSGSSSTSMITFRTAAPSSCCSKLKVGTGFILLADRALRAGNIVINTKARSLTPSMASATNGRLQLGSSSTFNTAEGWRQEAKSSASLTAARTSDALQSTPAHAHAPCHASCVPAHLPSPRLLPHVNAFLMPRAEFAK